jgi:hypothetical protein
MNEFRDAHSPPLPFPVQHALTQTVCDTRFRSGSFESLAELERWSALTLSTEYDDAKEHALPQRKSS